MQVLLLIVATERQTSASKFPDEREKTLSRIVDLGKVVKPQRADSQDQFVYVLQYNATAARDQPNFELDAIATATFELDEYGRLIRLVTDFLDEDLPERIGDAFDNPTDSDCLEEVIPLSSFKVDKSSGEVVASCYGTENSVGPLIVAMQINDLAAEQSENDEDCEDLRTFQERLGVYKILVLSAHWLIRCVIREEPVLALGPAYGDVEMSGPRQYGRRPFWIGDFNALGQPSYEIRRKFHPNARAPAAQIVTRLARLAFSPVDQTMQLGRTRKLSWPSFELVVPILGNDLLDHVPRRGVGALPPDLLQRAR